MQYYLLILIALLGINAFSTLSTTYAFEEQAPTHEQIVEKFDQELASKINSGNLQNLESLLTNPLFDINRPIHGKTPLLIAVEAYKTHVVQRFLKVPGIDPNLSYIQMIEEQKRRKKTMDPSMRRFHEAAIDAHLKAAGSSWLAIHPHWYAPLYQAVDTRQTGVVSPLLDAGADPNQLGSFGLGDLITPLQNALLSEAKEEIALILIRHPKLDWNKGVSYRFGSYRNYFELAVAQSNARILQEMLAQPQVRPLLTKTYGHRNCTILHTALIHFRKEYSDKIPLLLRALNEVNLDLNQDCPSYGTPLELAVRERDPDLVQVLLATGRVRPSIKRAKKEASENLRALNKTSSKEEAERSNEAIILELLKKE